MQQKGHINTQEREREVKVSSGDLLAALPVQGPPVETPSKRIRCESSIPADPGRHLVQPATSAPTPTADLIARFVVPDASVLVANLGPSYGDGLGLAKPASTANAVMRSRGSSTGAQALRSHPRCDWPMLVSIALKGLPTVWPHRAWTGLRQQRLSDAFAALQGKYSEHGRREGAGACPMVEPSAPSRYRPYSCCQLVTALVVLANAKLEAAVETSVLKLRLTAVLEREEYVCCHF